MKSKEHQNFENEIFESKKTFFYQLEKRDQIVTLWQNDPVR